MNKEYAIGAVLLGIMLAICVADYIQVQSITTGKWVFATIASLVGFCMALGRIIGGGR